MRRIIRCLLLIPLTALPAVVGGLAPPVLGARKIFILLLDWLAKLFAHAILKWLRPALRVFAVALGVTQVALGLQVILRSLSMIGLP